MTLKDVIILRAKCQYQLMSLRGKSLIEWAVLWFKMSNDAFYSLYGFNFNPHEYPYLYEIARQEVYGDIFKPGA